MDYIIGWQPFEVTFQGRPISMELRSCKAEAHMIIAPYVKYFRTKAQIEEMSEEEKIDLGAKMLEMQGRVKSVLPDHVRNIRGFTINGQAPSVEMLTEEAVFCELVIQIIGELAFRAVLTKEEEKNSGEPSGMPTPDGETTAP